MKQYIMTSTNITNKMIHFKVAIILNIQMSLILSDTFSLLLCILFLLVILISVSERFKFLS